MCCVAPLMPQATYRSGATLVPVWPTWSVCGRQPAMVTTREQPTAAFSTPASSSSMPKPSAEPTPRPPLTTTLASSSDTPAVGGHGAWRDNGYDCSGSVSFALAGAGLLRSPLTSGGFLNYGAPGPGRWITIYTHYGHIFMVVGGLRFDTSGQGRAGTRWQTEPRSTDGFATRHIPGL